MTSIDTQELQRLIDEKVRATPPLSGDRLVQAKLLGASVRVTRIATTTGGEGKRVDLVGTEVFPLEIYNEIAPAQGWPTLIGQT